MSMKLLIQMSALVVSALVATGCIFGGDSDSPTTISEVPKKTDSLPKAKSIVPGVYVGSYSEYDTSAQSIESEFILNADGSYRLFYIFGDDAFYDQYGSWFQKDSALYFLGALECNIDQTYGIFQNPTQLENDTNAIVNVTDTSFRRREYTPLRQKPYWISYVRKSVPRLKDGSYFMEKTVAKDSAEADQKFVIDLAKGDFTFSYSVSAALRYQINGKFSLAGSFLVTENNRSRSSDTAQVLSDWVVLDGHTIQRLRSISDESFSMLSNAFGYESGNFDAYTLAHK